MDNTNPMHWTLISVHVPKTAGTSFRQALQRAYGNGLRLDNDDRPMSHPRWQRRAGALRDSLSNAGRSLPEACVHGHFLALKYACVRQARFAVWMRDPVQRMVSRYFHYVRHCQNEPHHLRWGLAPGLSLEEFVRLPQYWNTASEYLWGFPRRRLDFVGIVEQYDTEIERFARHFDLEGKWDGDRANRNPARKSSGYELDPALERLIRRCNAEDQALYDWACERRSSF